MSHKARGVRPGLVAGWPRAADLMCRCLFSSNTRHGVVLVVFRVRVLLHVEALLAPAAGAW